MGRRSNEAIGRVRHYGGVALLAGVQLGMFGALCAASVSRPRYRRVLPFYLSFAWHTLDSARRRERFEGVSGIPDRDRGAPGDR